MTGAAIALALILAGCTGPESDGHSNRDDGSTEPASPPAASQPTLRAAEPLLSGECLGRGEPLCILASSVTTTTTGDSVTTAGIVVNRGATWLYVPSLTTEWFNDRNELIGKSSNSPTISIIKPGAFSPFHVSERLSSDDARFLARARTVANVEDASPLPPAPDMMLSLLNIRLDGDGALRAALKITNNEHRQTKFSAVFVAFSSEGQLVGQAEYRDYVGTEAATSRVEDPAFAVGLRSTPSTYWLLGPFSYP